MTSDRRPAAADVIARLGAASPADAALVDDYYTLCIPAYRGFLGAHWHTGWHDHDGPPRVEDKLEMELRIARSAAIGAGSRVADVGCGIGGPACHLAMRLGATFVGISPVAEQLQLARELAVERGAQDRVTFVQGRAEALPLDDASVDAVVFFESACHFEDRPAFFREALRVLRPGGRIAGEDWLSAPGAAGAADAASWHRAVERRWAIPRLGSLHDYAAGLRAAGFCDVEAVDLRDEMRVERGFAATPDARRAIRAARSLEADPMRRKILDALELLGEATERGAFTIGRFAARRP